MESPVQKDSCGGTIVPSAGRAAEEGQGAATTESQLQVTCATSDEDIEDVVRLFEEIAAAEGWKPEGELRAHVLCSTYFGLWQPGSNGTQNSGLRNRGTVIGGLQLVHPDAAGKLPSQRVWPELPIDARKGVTAHIAVLAVDATWRGKAGGLFWLLTAAMWHHCVQSGIRELWLEATPRTMRCYERFGWPLEVKGELREHWGEPCYPCRLSVREVAGALTERAVRSRVYRRILADMVGGDSRSDVVPLLLREERTTGS